MHRQKRWIIAPPSEKAEPLAACLKTSPLIAQMLLNRGLCDAEACRKFLSPSLKDLYAPESLSGVPQAAERLLRAIRDRERVVIYGDYDVDGITGTAILWHAIRLLGGEVDYYVPHRLEEGYGLNAEAINQICDAGATLIVSVDCGITAVGEARIARERGVDMVITDHHEWKEVASPEGVSRPQLPECHAIVHPRLPMADGSIYPNPSLCGSGVAFKLAWALGVAHQGSSRVSEPFRRFLVEATALAALGTIADVVPLSGENRLLAHYGLNGLRRSQLIGIRALIESAGLGGQALDSYHVGFLLAPRLNACGRMGHASEAVEMLTRADEAQARATATALEKQNRARQAVEKQIFEEAMAQAKALGCDSDECRGVVLGAAGWHPGVIGIVASRVVSRLNRPTVLVALSNGHGHGSARSIPGFHLARALEACREHLQTSGGHEMAAGLRLESSRVEQFRAAFDAYARQLLTPEMLMPELRLDCVAELRQISEALVADLHRLGPFGTSNPKPLLCCPGVEVVAARQVGRGADHLQLAVRQGGVTMRCIAFGLGGWAGQLQPGTRVDLAVEPCINEYNGSRSVQLDVRDLRINA